MQPTASKTRYIESIGRRKTAAARVRIYPGTNKPLKGTEKFDVIINNRSVDEYFKIQRLRDIAVAPFMLLNSVFKVSAAVEGGGASAQAEAVRLGLSRALDALNEKWHTPLKAAGFLKRDSRMVERKKPGSRKARRPQQWRKR